MNRIFTYFIVLAFAAVAANAQTVTSPPKNPAIKPSFLLEDVVFAFNVMSSIEILGAEVEPFLECKNFLKGIIDKAQSESKKTTDKVQVDMPLVTAQNLSTFLSRGKFKGENAENYKRLMDAMVEAAKVIQK